MENDGNIVGAVKPPLGPRQQCTNQVNAVFCKCGTNKKEICWVVCVCIAYVIFLFIFMLTIAETDSELTRENFVCRIVWAL